MVARTRPRGLLLDNSEQVIRSISAFDQAGRAARLIPVRDNLPTVILCRFIQYYVSDEAGRVYASEKVKILAQDIRDMPGLL